MATYESRNERDQRVVKIWEALDTRREGQIDFNGLKKGLKKIDHPLKNADGMLREVLQAVDTNGDGRIDYAEFRAFVDYAENKLWPLFRTIDFHETGRFDKDALKLAFERSGVTVSSARIDEFFEDVDKNKDGVITYAEWRDFLLFLPAHSSSDLHAVLSYFKITGNVNLDGDVQMNKQGGLGTANSFPSHYFQAMRDLLYSIFPVYALTTVVPSAYAETGGCAEPGPALRSDDIAPLDADLELEWLPVPMAVAIVLSIRYYKQKLTENTPQLGYFVAGGIAGVVSRTATAPLDRLKVYLIAQSGVNKGAVRAAKEGATLKAAGSASKTLVNAVKDLWRAGGIRSLFAGNGLNVIKVMPESAIKFGGYESARRAFARFEGHNDPKKLKPTSQFLSGGIGGMVAQCFVYPIDTLKFQMQCSTVEGGLKGNRLIIATFKKVWNKHGLYGFFRGLPLGLTGMFPYAAIDLTTFEYLKRAVLARKARKDHCHEEDVVLSNFTTGAIGAVSGAFSASVVYPLNVLRTRLQAQGTILHPSTYTGIGDVARKTVQVDGFRGLYRGITPNLMKVAPAVSISWVAYENSKRILGLK